LCRRNKRSLDETLNRSFYSLLYLAQALASQDLPDLAIAVVSNRMQQVFEEHVHDPARAVLFGPARVIPKELPGIVCRCIDVETNEGQVTECAARIVTEMAAVREESTVAFRGGERFVETLERLSLAAGPERPRLQSRGVYLITGGLGGIGLVVAEHLAREFKANLILVGRSALPPEDKWEASLKDLEETESNRQKIQKLMDIRSCAAGLLVVQGDVTDLGQMRGAVNLAKQRFGRIDGSSMRRAFSMTAL